LGHGSTVTKRLAVRQRALDAGSDKKRLKIACFPAESAQKGGNFGQKAPVFGGYYVLLRQQSGHDLNRASI
jgi:hypothetical protein